MQSAMSTPEPGLDRREWETEWSQLEEDLESSPGETLPAVDDLVGRMLEARGYAIDDAVAEEGVEPEVLAEWRAAHEVAGRLDAGEPVDPGDVASAVNGYRALYETLIAERSTP
jgi:hypothetical protein